MLSLMSFQIHLTTGHKRDGIRIFEKYILSYIIWVSQKVLSELTLLFKQSACLFLVYASSLYKNQTFESMIHTQCRVMGESQGENKLVRQ